MTFRLLDERLLRQLHLAIAWSSPLHHGMIRILRVGSFRSKPAQNGDGAFVIVVSVVKTLKLTIEENVGI
ncbi:hypothetical protein Mapa_006779 [Marchantia paleacea]|nr:hypothetical protein Mapa_006779 [Marchantia paleacea]